MAAAAQALASSETFLPRGGASPSIAARKASHQMSLSRPGLHLTANFMTNRMRPSEISSG